MTGPKPYVFEDTGEVKRFAPATERNRDAITDVLRYLLPTSGLILEVASGTGEHAVHFAQAFPHLTFQPSDPDPAALASISAWSRDVGLANVLPPVQLDASASDWLIEEADAILCINMVHISPWAATLGLMQNSARILPTGAPLYLYGPYRQQNVQTAPSNEEFDASLKSRNPEWGLRSVEDVANAAEGFVLDRVIEMAANNLSLVFYKS